MLGGEERRNDLLGFMRIAQTYSAHGGFQALCYVACVGDSKIGRNKLKSAYLEWEMLNCWFHVFWIVNPLEE